MKRSLYCTGILGGGTALVFALAFAVAAIFPQGALIQASWNGGFMQGGPVPMPMVGGFGPGVIMDGTMTKDVFVAAPAAIPVPAPAIEVPAAIESPQP
jgi:hypothetical protein